MVRNIDHRIETTIPVYNPAIQQELQKMLDIQMTEEKTSRGKTSKEKTRDVQDQVYEYVESLSKPPLKKIRK
jgi:polyphosphate kinase